jgi:hypothetical protein
MVLVFDSFFRLLQPLRQVPSYPVLPVMSQPCAKDARGEMCKKHRIINVNRIR